MISTRQAKVSGIKAHDPFGMLLVGRNWEGGSEYRYGFNGKESDDEISGNNNDLDFGARVYDSRLGRWFSPDPLTSKYASWSSYVSFMNNPIIIIDPDGRDNVIYLVLLPSASTALTKQDITDIINMANANFESLGVKTKVYLASDNFDPNTSPIDATDGIAVLGASIDVVKYIRQYDKAYADYLEERGFDHFSNTTYPENSYGPDPKLNPNGKKTIAIDANDLLPTAGEVNTGDGNKITEIEMGALVINHGAAHTAGASHVGDNLPGEKRYTVSVIMNGKDKLIKAIRDFGYNKLTRDSLDETQIVDDPGGNGGRKTTLNPDYDTHMKAGYGNNDPKPNPDLIKK